MSALAKLESIELEQGSYEWHAFRKTRITATDACVIMGANHWKTKIQLYNEKLSDDLPSPPNERMQRGLDLEPLARDLFALQTGIVVEPRVVVKDWLMASLDGINAEGTHIVEIKCPGPKDHAIALAGRVPDHYYPQLQHQMFVCDVQEMYYFSFDGTDGVAVLVRRDDEYIEKMVTEEKKFYDCIMNKIPPEPSEDDYIEREDSIWLDCAARWKAICKSIEDLEKEKEDLKKQIIFLSGESNTKGGGISLCQISRKGNVDYAKIPELKRIDLEIYRKPAINSWRIS